MPVKDPNEEDSEIHSLVYAHEEVHAKLAVSLGLIVQVILGTIPYQFPYMPSVG